MSIPRVIEIRGCVNAEFRCPHVHDWSSAGLCCAHPSLAESSGERVIVSGLEPRSPWRTKVPDWCPLPFATGISYVHAIGKKP